GGGGAPPSTTRAPPAWSPSPARGGGLGERFLAEARASLPMFGGEAPALFEQEDPPPPSSRSALRTVPLPRFAVEELLDDVFAAVGVQQLRLRMDQQAPVWEPGW
ncbi:MAG TPA: hypothetical protein VGS12_03645, partial [Caulobacteraceae bacterium]|nr:hypothetical protein [Caulobacteraceae bacterium]